MEEALYLKPNVVFEPLIDKWYAWSHLISPATAAMNITGRHLKIFDSYISAPDLHLEAVKNPKLLGGPFMDIPIERLEEVKDLRAGTILNRSNMMQFSQAIKELDELLLQEAKGFALENLYDKIPAILKGYVELYYNRNGTPSFRFFEALLYHSQFYDKSSQSLALWLTNNDHRPFCLSTPRLNDPNVIELNLPFDSALIDELAKMKRVPRHVSGIKELLKISKDQESLFDTFFTDEPLPTYKRYTGDKIRMRYFGHACILIETRDVCILADPLISYYGYFSDIEHFSDADLPDVIDYVIITHNHQDHILFETLLPLRHKIRNVVVPRAKGGRLEDPDLKLMFNSIGFQNVIELDELETVNFADVSITGIPFNGEHSDLNITSKICHLIRIGEFKLLFMADSRVLEPNMYKHVYSIIGDVDVVFLGMECEGAPLTWLYGPLLTNRIARDQDHSRTLSGCDCDRGMVIVDIFKPKEVYVYAMGQEPWIEFITSKKYTESSGPIVESDRLVRKCQQKGIIAERLFGEKELFYEREIIF